MDLEAKKRELQELNARAEQLEKEIRDATSTTHEEEWPPRHFYSEYHALAGFVLGIFGATTSLLFNIIGSVLLLPGHSPLRIIQVYLTFPLGEKAMQVTEGLTLAIGCCLYLGTGMVLGMVFHLVLTRWFDRSSFVVRFVVVTLLSLALWIVNFYGILSWLQPLVVGLPEDYAMTGGWKSMILREIPWWVAASTHLVFGWTMLLVQPWGQFVTSTQRAPATSVTER